MFVVEKKCLDCGEVKLVDDFKYGNIFLSMVCNDCRNRSVPVMESDKERELLEKEKEIKRERNRQSVIKYRRLHPEVGKVSSNNRRAREYKNGGRITEKEWIDLKRKHKNTCLCCRRQDIKLTLDHVVPLVLGGENSISNAQPLCGHCNSRKGTRIIDYRDEK